MFAGISTVTIRSSSSSQQKTEIPKPVSSFSRPLIIIAKDDARQIARIIPALLTSKRISHDIGQTIAFPMSVEIESPRAILDANIRTITHFLSPQLSNTSVKPRRTEAGLRGRLVSDVCRIGVVSDLFTHVLKPVGGTPIQHVARPLGLQPSNGVFASPSRLDQFDIDCILQDMRGTVETEHRNGFKITAFGLFLKHLVEHARNFFRLGCDNQAKIVFDSHFQSPKAVSWLTLFSLPNGYATSDDRERQRHSRMQGGNAAKIDAAEPLPGGSESCKHHSEERISRNVEARNRHFPSPHHHDWLARRMAGYAVTVKR